jgi:ankyrin repeat protein
VEDGDIERVRFSLDNGADANALGLSKETPLMLAIADGREDLVDLLLPKSDPEKIGANGYTALLRAAQCPYPRILSRVLEVADPKKPSEGYGRTPLMMAAELALARNVEMLLPVSDVEALDSRGVSALMRAKECRVVGSQIVVALIESWIEACELEKAVPGGSRTGRVSPSL